MPNSLSLSNSQVMQQNEKQHGRLSNLLQNREKAFRTLRGKKTWRWVDDTEVKTESEDRQANDASSTDIKIKYNLFNSYRGFLL